MVFLRLTVKVYPRDQTPPSNSFSFRSLLGDRERDDSSRTSSGATAGKPASFLIVLEKPEDVTLGGLAGMIRAKWRKLRPGVGPLEIKKLLDDDHENDDLDTDMTVADVFVDNGKARSDGLDQRRTVRVIQKPARGEEDSPVRFPSVAQDWDAAAENYEIQRQKKQEAELAVNKLGPIAEESRRGSSSTSPIDVDGWSNYNPNRTHRRDIPVSSVEKDDEIPVSPSQQPRKSSTRELPQEFHGEDLSAPQDYRMESEELGDSPRSSCAETPKKKPTPARGESTHSQGPSNRSGSVDAPVFDSPGLQLAREHTHSVSPQKKPAPKVAKTAPISLDEETQSESESEASDDDLENNEIDKGERGKNGDIAMRDADSPRQQKQSPVGPKQPIPAVEIPGPNSTVLGAQSRKRKNSTDQLSPNKEPRLDRPTTPPVLNGEGRDSQVLHGTPIFSPSGRRLGGTASFSGVARRLSFTERQSEPPSQGLGFGITMSPPKKPSVLVDLSHSSVQSTGDVPKSTPVPASSAPTVRRGSITQNMSTPTNLPTPADKAKNLHSALRKDTSVERNSARLSVSFAEGDEVLITGSQPAPTSTPLDSAKPSKSTPSSQSTDSEKRRSSGSMVFPPGISMERIAKIEREAQEKFEQEKKLRAEFEEKIKNAEKDKANPAYLKKVKAAFNTWQSILKNKTNNRKSRVDTEIRLQNQLKAQQAEIKKIEDTMRKPSSQDKERKAQSSQKTAKSQQSPKNDTPPRPKSTTPAPTANGDEKSPITHISGWNAINAKSLVENGKSAAPTANGVAPKSTPKAPTARTVATKTLAGSKASKPASLQSQNSTASDDVDLPAMKVQARANANANDTKKRDELELPETNESSDEETSSDDSSESESESDSESDSASETEATAKNKSATTSSSKFPATSSQRQLRAVSVSVPPSAQRTSKSPAPSSQQTSQAPSQTLSQTESWRWPRASQTAPSTRLSLKSIKGQVASQVQAQAAAKAAPLKRAQPRRDIFSPPDSDSNETESESESESESSSSSESESESESGSDNEGKKGKKRSNSPDSVGDAGDIMSSGRIQKLRPARVGSRV